MKLHSARNYLILLSVVLSGCITVLFLLPYAGGKVVEIISDQVGVDLQVEDIGGNIFTHLTFARIKGNRQEESLPLREFEVCNLRVAYSLAELVYGSASFLSSLKFDLSRLHAVVDMIPEQQASQPAAARGGLRVLPRVLPALRVDDFDLFVYAPQYELSMRDTVFVIETPSGTSGQAVTVDIPLLHLKSGGQEKVNTAASFSMQYTADGIRLDNATMGDALVAMHGSLGWPKGEQAIVWDVWAAFCDGNLETSGSFASGKTTLQLQVERIDLADLARLFRLEDFPVAGKISGTASSRFDSLSNDSLTANLDIRLSEGELLAEKTEALLQGSIKEGRLAVQKFAGHFGINEVEMEKGLLPLSLFSAWDTALLGNVSMKSVRLHLQNIPAFFTALGEEVSLAAVPEHTLDLQGSLAEGRVKILQANFTTSQNSLLLQDAELQLASIGQPLLDSPFAGVLRFRLGSIPELAALIDLPEMKGNVSGDAVVNGTLRRPVGTLSIKGTKLSYGQCSLGDIAIRAEADTSSVNIHSLVLQNESDIVEGRGQYFFDSGTVANVNGRVVVRNIDRYSDSCLKMEDEIAGRFQAVLSSTDQGALQADLQIEDAVFAGFSVPELQGRIITDRNWYRIEDGSLSAEFGTVRFSSLTIPQRGQEGIGVRTEFTGLAVTYNGVDFTLEKPAAIVFSHANGGSVDVDEMLLRSRVGDILVTGVLSRQGESSFLVQATDMTSIGWLDDLTDKDFQVDGADMFFTLQGPLISPNVSLKSHFSAISCPQLTIPVSGDLDLGYQGGAGFAIHKFQLKTDLGQHISLSGNIPYDPLAKNHFLAHPFSLTGSIAFPRLTGFAINGPFNGAGEGKFSSDFQLAGSLDKPTARLQFSGTDIFLHHFLKNVPQEPLAVAGRMHFQSNTFRFENVTVQSKPFSLKIDGTWSEIPPFTKICREPPSERPGMVSMKADLSMSDISWLSSYMGGLCRLSGRMHSSLVVNGPAARPDFTGNMQLSDGKLRLESSTLPHLDNLSIRAALQNRTVYLQEMSGRIGGAPIQATGDLVFSRAEGPDVDCRLQGSNILFFRDDSMKIRGDADLLLQGPLSRLKLTGKVLHTDSRYSKNVDFLTLFRGSSKPKAKTGMQFFSFVESPLRDMIFDIQIAAAEPFYIANNLTRGAVRPALRLAGTGEIPVLVGRIYVDSTKIFVPAGKILIESGIVTFPESDPDHPTFDLTARSRLAGYDITMQLQGTSQEPVITLSSDPPLPEDDLLLLVLTGTPPQSAEGASALANMKLAVYLGKGLLSRWFGGSSLEDDESVLDRFDLDFGRSISKTGQETVEAQFRLFEGILLPGDRLYITSEKDVYDNYNVGAKIVFRFK